MPHGDDLDRRFNELVAQIDTGQQRRMRAAARKAARTPRVGPVWTAMAGITAVIVAAGVVVMFRPDLLASSGFAPVDTPLSSVPNGGDAPLTGETTPARGTRGAAEGPFAGTRAAGWPDGAAGFVMPAATATGGLSEQDVAEGLRRARDLLAAAHLDHETLMGGEPAAFMRLLHPGERSWFAERLDRDGSDDTRRWVTSLAPGSAERAGATVKVRGRTALSPFTLDGREGARLETDHVIVHAVQRPGRPDTAIPLVTRRHATFLLYREAGEVVVWVDRSGGYATPARCDGADAFVHPLFDGSTGAAGAPVDPYELDGPRPGHDCLAAKET
ncbi:hypothetical protein FAF44_40670 [Nonomuraea sp. MG754425]|uniref:hypothetical protein n=1 Tax=Nonomuraea sp. MG754425 TaxID=2570319 RepID=UPI001F1B0EDE|nr:hypothetical protein [Nonomuraea sp. MG754425]MCF6474650.1 hypothetical protein [Nonomuraea sp. MG754425]